MVRPDLFRELSDVYDPVASYDTNKIKTAASLDEARGHYIYLDVFQELEKQATFMSVTDVAKMTGCSENLIRKQIRGGKLLCTRIGDRIVLNPSDVLAWLKARSNAEN